MSDKIYISAANTAKMVRKSLKEAFPGQAFYVRTRTYSGGASIDLDWMNGPTAAEVDSIINVYKGADFDGMIDLKIYVSHWLLPDGSIQIAKSPGTAGSNGMISPIENAKPHPNAKMVHFGVDYIHTVRAYSREFIQQAAEQVNAETGWDIPEIAEWSWFTGGKERGKQYSFKPDYTTDGFQAQYFDKTLRETSANSLTHHKEQSNA